MFRKKTGGPAFPTTFKDKNLGYGGMTLRDWLAAHASEKDIEFWITEVSDSNSYPRERARYMYADAMIEERDKE